MSGGPHHNPHGRPGQPASWNHLQASHKSQNVPNYFPRQPQVAHMSSERPLSHSPLTWHTPTPPEHPQGGKPTYRHTPTPPDAALKGAPAQLFRHTPTPPDRDSLKSYRHTPTPPDPSHKAAPYRHTPPPSDALKGGLYHHTPPPDGHKGAPSPLFNLQQMISDTRNVQAQRLGESLRDNLSALAENFHRHSPSLALGSMDLSVTRSPRNGNQNGEMGIPISLSVRDASKINSLDSAEITKIQVPVGYLGKNIEITKASSPTLNSMNQSSNSPKSPKSNKRPLKKVDSILERLNSGGDGVVITPVRHTQSPHSVIVSAHSLEDSNSRGSSCSLNITPVPPPSCDLSVSRSSPPPAPRLGLPPPHDTPSPCLPTPTCTLPQSVIMDSALAPKEQPPSLASFVSEDSNGSSSDSSKSKRRRKQIKTSKIENDSSHNSEQMKHDSLYLPPAVPTTDAQQQPNIPNSENHTEADTSRVQIHEVPVSREGLPQPELDTNANTKAAVENGIPLVKRRSSSEDNSVPVVSKTRRKTCSESETIDNIAAMIASTNSSDIVTKELQESTPPDTLLGSETESKQTDQLRQVLGSPVSETKLEIKDVPLQNEACTKPQRRRRSNQSNSIDSSHSENGKLTESKEVKSESENNKSQSSSFVEVENELEKMFAGIESESQDLSSSLDPVTGLMIEHDANTPGNVQTNTTTTRKKRASRRSSIASTGLLSSDENTPKKKRKSNKRAFSNSGEQYSNNVDVLGGKKSKKNKDSKSNKANKKERSKIELLSHKDAYDSGSNASSSKSRGPYVQIRGPRDSPLSVSVINTPIQEDDTDKPLQKIKTMKTKTSLNSDSDFRNKVKSKGLHSSTLSMKYDATTTDTTWICVFCKRGPHNRGTLGSTPQGKTQHMGDLFGPYIISTNCPDYGTMMNDPQDTMFKNRCKQGTFSQNKQAKPQGRKLKVEPESSESDRIKFPNEEMYLGMKEAGANSLEVWVHEDCAVWAPGLYLIGAKLVGLEGAVWGCCTVRCDRCQLLGASVACIQHGCRSTMHVNCARAALWALSEEDFLVHCPQHGRP